MTTSNRRLLRFSLRVLLAFILVVAVGIHLASTLIHVRGRDQAHRVYPIVASYSDPGAKQPPLVWRWLGATPVSVVSLGPAATDSDIAKLQRLFPEARIVVLKDD
jgi:hypothetical protein